MITEEVETTIIPVIDDNEGTEIEVAQETTGTEAAQEMTEVAADLEMIDPGVVLVMTEAVIAETEATTDARMKITPETIGTVANVATQISLLEQNVIGVGHQRAVVEEGRPNNGLVMIGDQATERNLNKLDLVIGNAPNVRK